MGRYDETILAHPSLVGYWPMDEDSGNAIDLKAARNGTVEAGITRRAAGPVRGSYAYDGDGTNAVVSVAHASALNGSGTAFEAEIWIHHEDLGLYFWKGGTHYYGFRILATGAVQAYLNTTSGAVSPTSAAGVVRSGEWNMISLVQSSGFLLVYVNGVLVIFAAAPGSITTNTAVLQLTGNAAAGDDPSGKFSRAAFYNAILTSEERIDHYKAGLYEAPLAPRQRPRRSLTWSLCDLDGNEIEPITQRLSGEVEVQLNGVRAATVTASLEERVAREVQAFACSLKVWLSGTLLHWGPVTLPRFISESGGQRVVEISSVCPSERLARGYTKGLAAQLQVDQAKIMETLIAHLNTRASGAGKPDTGVTTGSTPTSYLRDRFFPDGTNVWEALVAMSEITNGPDFELNPLDRTDGVYAELNTFFPYQGHDRTAEVVLAKGTAENNAVAISAEPGGGEIVNYAVFAGQAQEGQPAPGWIAQNAASQAAHGLYEHFEALPDVTRTATLQEHAEQLVAAKAWPIDFIDVTPVTEAGGLAYAWARDPETQEWKQESAAYAVPPRFGPIDSGGDYWLGDEITIIARDGELRDEWIARVTQARFAEVGPEGHVAVELECAPRITASGVSGSATTVSTEDFS